MSYYFGQYDVSARVIADNELAFAFPSNTPIVPGHTLVVPKRVVVLYEDLSAEEKAAMEDLRIQMKGALQNVFAAEGFNYAWNEAAVGGQSVAHLHLHILPRKAGDAGVHSYEPREFLYRPGARVVSSDEELMEVARMIKEAL